MIMKDTFSKWEVFLAFGMFGLSLWKLLDIVFFLCHHLRWV